MIEYLLDEQLYLYPTPAGAFYAVSAPNQEPARKVLNCILGLQNTPKLTLERIRQWASISTISDEDDKTITNTTDEATLLLKHMQDLGWIQGCQNYHSSPTGSLEDNLPNLLYPLSSVGTVLLADDQGLSVSHTGFSDHHAEQLAALSADIANLHEKHQGLLSDQTGVQSNAWASVDAAGNSHIGFWPLYIGKHRLVLVIGGLPRLNQEFFTQLIWVLSIRYGNHE